MSFKRVESASDLVRFGCSLKIECTSCGAATTLAGVEVAMIHPTASLDQLRARLKCRRCRRKVARVVVLPPV